MNDEVGMRSDIAFELEGWELFWADLEARSGDPECLRRTRRAVGEEVRSRLELPALASHPPVAAMRALFRAAGTDPTRYRPSSEALLRRLLKGDDIPAIHPLVDLANSLSARLAVPCCVMREGSFEGPFQLRSGLEGEAYDSLRGPFKLTGRPLLVDRLGPCDTPITGSRRVMVTDTTERATLVAYLPAGLVSLAAAGATLDALLEDSGAARTV